MAILPGVPGLEVTIQVGDKAMREYEFPLGLFVRREYPVLQTTVPTYPGAGDRKPCLNGYSAKFIEVESGSPARVEFAKAQGYRGEGDHIAYSCMFDDIELKIRHEPPGFKDEEWEDATDSMVVGDDDVQKSVAFRFADMKCILDENESRDLQFQNTSNVGRIRICVYHMLAHREDLVTGYHQDPILTPEAMTEQAMKKKAHSHRLQLTPGSDIESPEPEYLDDFYDKTAVPFAVYDFYYRDRGALEKLNVIPREISAGVEDDEDDDCEIKPGKPESEDSNSDLSKKELLAKLRRLKHLNRSKKRGLREKSTSHGRDSPATRMRKRQKIKQEMSEAIVIEID